MTQEQEYHFDCGYCPNKVVVRAAGMKPAFEKWEAGGFMCDECRKKEHTVSAEMEGEEWGGTL